MKSDEYRVAMLPVGAELLCEDGHTVLVEADAGLESGYPDQDYLDAGATIVGGAEGIYRQADMIIKVKVALAHG